MQKNSFDKIVSICQILTLFSVPGESHILACSLVDHLVEGQMPSSAKVWYLSIHSVALS